MDVDRLYVDVVRELERRADVEQARKEMYFHKQVGAGFQCYGISAPEFKEIAKKFKQAFRELGFEDRFELARRFFRSGYGGQMSFGIALLKLNVKDMKPSDFWVLEDVGDCLNNWGTVDGFCIDVLQPLLLAYPDEVLSILRRWNRSESLWKRRASVVVFTRNIGKSGKFTEEALKLCNGLIWDKGGFSAKGRGLGSKRHYERRQRESAGIRQGAEAERSLSGNNAVCHTRLERKRSQSSPRH
ncbi:DNA alkylation repair protein [Candidatus Bathyarchaeota archaeon]|nr:DNA alkylation repair protein [Candidatus Bathyarchaeota archaeon]